MAELFRQFQDKKSKKNTVSDVIKDVKAFEADSKWLLLAPIHLENGRALEDKLKALLNQGFSRILVNNETVRLDGIEAHTLDNKDILLIIDRIVVKDEEEFYNRLADAVQTAFYEGKGICYLQELDTDKRFSYSNNFELDGINFLEPNVHLFSFNNPYGAVPFVKVMEISSELTKNW